MTTSLRYLSLACLALSLLVTACGPVGANVQTNNNNGLTNQNQNWNNQSDATVVPGFVKLKGTVWSPGADLAETLEVNRFPIPGAAVVAYHARPDDLPQGMYCNECMDVPAGTPKAMSDPVTGEFELTLMPGRTYYLTIQKGEFRRVRQVVTPDTPDEVWEPAYQVGGPRPDLLTLPSTSNPSTSDNVPKIAVITAEYEEMDQMFNAMGMAYNGADVHEVSASIVNDRNQLDAYNLVVVPCGENWPGGNGEVLKQWVRDGGKLYVDDFNYDFVEQVWPEFLSWYVYEPLFTGSTGPCATSTSPGTSVNSCNNWGSYDFNGDPGDPDFDAWLRLEEVNRGAGIFLQAAWDYIYEMGEGIVGVSDECTGNCGPNGEVYMLPKVWMYNADGTSFDNRPPATVSWPYYCGKVLYTVYHTHSGYEEPYELLLQEKIMMYLIMEIQTCSTGPIVR
ncbi:MAG: hypothetical protein RBU30_06845 [Polyangia bacterium]|nr:hypothetical protein [Polyangia bacterium]